MAQEVPRAAMANLPVPTPFNIHDQNASDGWRRWRERLECYMTATGLNKMDKNIQVSTFLTVIGSESHEVYSTFDWGEVDPKEATLSQVMEKFSQYCTPRGNVTFERYRFNSRGQHAGESLEQYVTELRKLSAKCEFNSVTPDQLLRDRIVFGLRDDKVRERLLRESMLSLEKCLEICRASEVSLKQLQEVKQIADSSASVSQIAKKQKPSRNVGQQKSGHRQQRSEVKCKYCNREHAKKKESCPAYGKTCSKCGKQNHFAAVCKTATEAVHAVTERREVYSVRSVSSVLRAEQTVTLDISRTAAIRFQIDTGADVNVLPLHVYKNATRDVHLKNVQRSYTRLQGYGKHEMTSRGKVKLDVWRGGQRRSISCEIVQGTNFHSILGAKTCEELGLIQVLDNDALNPPTSEVNIHTVQGQNFGKPITEDQLKREFPEVFRSTVGLLAGEHKITIDPAVRPVQHAPRRVPEALRTRLRKELETMEKNGIIERIEVPTEWINSMVIVPKTCGLRICLDPRDLNKAVKREKYQLPTIEDVASRLTGAKIFSLLDVKSGFWHIKLTEESSLLTTFHTPFGRYKYKRLPFGINSAPEIFQRKMHEVVEGLSGTEVVADDFLIYGCGDTLETAIRDHDVNLRKFLERCRQKNVVLNAEKMKLRTTSVPFIGHVATSAGLGIAPEKVSAVVHMPTPSDIAGVRRFLGLVQYLAKFLPSLSDMTASLRELCKKDAEFIWSSPQEKAFQAVKDAATNVPVLRYYDLNKEVTIQCDASQTGLGAALMQEGQPVAYASRALTDTEQRYAQIEKECLAIVWSCEKFHQYLFGRDLVTVESDHQPLESIFKKNLEKAPARLQRMLLRLQKYNLKVVYKRGKDMLVADTLSRAYLTEESLSKSTASLARIDPKLTLVVRDENHKKIKAETQADEELQTLTKIIHGGWPANRVNVPESIRQYFNVRDELTVDDGLVYRSDRLVVPTALRREMLEKAHQGHVGMEGCLRRIRDALYWPNMSSQMRSLVSQCGACQTHADNPPREELIQHEVPERAWTKVAADLCQIGDRYLLVVDYYSNFVEVCRLHTTTSYSVICALKEMFARFGVPAQLVSDNGRQFSSEEFRKFSKEWDFMHITSSPHYSQSNGKAENAVRTVKRLFKKCAETGESEYLALLNWRNTPTEGMETSPAQRMMGRRCKTLLPTRQTLLTPMHETAVDVAKLKEKKKKQAYYYNRTTKKRRSLGQGETVRMRLPQQQRWTPGIVHEQVAPRSYDVQVGESMYRRNARHLRPSDEPPQESPETIDHNGQEIVSSSEQPQQQQQQSQQQPQQQEPQQAQFEATRRSRRTRLAVKRFGYDD